MFVQRFYYSRLKLGGMTFAIAAILIAPGLFCISTERDNTLPGKLYVATVSTLFFFLALLVVSKFYKVVVEQKPVVTITDMGIVDTRISKDMIAWEDVKSVQLSGSRDRTIHLQLSPGARKRLRLTAIAHFYNLFLGVVGIASGPLAVRDNALLGAIERRIESHKAMAEGEGKPGFS